MKHGGSRMTAFRFTRCFMKLLQSLVIAVLAAAATAAAAQGGPAETSGPCVEASGATSPGARCGPAGPYRMPRYGGPRDTPGWPMMAPKERQAHRERMASFKTYAECRAYIDQHHQKMAERAKKRGVEMPTRVPSNACHWLKAKPGTEPGGDSRVKS